MDEYEVGIRERLKGYMVHDFIFPPHFQKKAKEKRGIHELDVAKLLQQENILKIEPGHSGRTIVYIKHSANYVTKAILILGEKLIIVTAHRYPAKLV